MKILSKSSGSDKKTRAVRTKFEEAKQLSITSLLDALTIILCFLIKNVSTEAVSVSEVQGIKYPSTITNDELLKKAGTTPIKMYLDKIELGSESLEFGTPQELFSNNEKRANILNYLTLEATDLVKQGNEPCLIVQADEFMPCEYISEIVSIGTSAGYTNIYFATLSDPEWLNSYSMLTK